MQKYLFVVVKTYILVDLLTYTNRVTQVDIGLTNALRSPNGNNVLIDFEPEIPEWWFDFDHSQV